MDSLGPLIGPVVVPPDACPRFLLLLFLAVVSFPSGRMCTPRNLCIALVTRALSTLSSAVSQCWCLTGPQQPPIGGCEYIYLFLFLLAKVGRRNTFDTLQVLFVPRVKSSLTDWKFVYGNAMIEIRRGIVLLRVNIWEGFSSRDRSKDRGCIVFYLWRRVESFFSNET